MLHITFEKRLPDLEVLENLALLKPEFSTYVNCIGLRMLTGHFGRRELRGLTQLKFDIFQIKED